MNPQVPRTPAGAAPAGFLPDARKSHGVEALAATMAAQPDLYVLDFGGPVQENIDFVTGAGHRLYIDDLLKSYDYFFSPKEQEENDFRPGRIDEFIQSVLPFPDHAAGAVLLWDRLQYLPAALAGAIVVRLRSVLAPQALLLTLFRTDQSGSEHAPYGARILDGQLLLLREQQRLRPTETYNPRSIHHLFEHFGEVRFFVSRESLQEVIIRR
jgi:hypothetical protein